MIESLWKGEVCRWTQGLPSEGVSSFGYGNGYEYHPYYYGGYGYHPYYYRYSLDISPPTFFQAAADVATPGAGCRSQRELPSAQKGN
jgi:hypothetical protein